MSLSTVMVCMGCRASGSKSQLPTTADRIESAFHELETGNALRDTVAGSIRSHDYVPSSANKKISPDWVQNRPSNPKFYHGIAHSSNDMTDARARALGDLVSSIEVEVVNVVSSILLEEGTASGSGRVRSSGSWHVNLLAKQTINNPEWVGYWSWQGKHWAYARIPKKAVEESLSRKLANAKDMAMDHLIAGNRLEEQRLIVEALHSYISGLVALRDYLGQVVEGFVANRRVVLNNELIRRASGVANKIELEQTGKKSLWVRKGRGLKEPLKVSVHHRNVPLPGVPVAFKVSHGKADLSAGSIMSGSDGIVEIWVRRVGSEGANIEAVIDLKKLVGGIVHENDGLPELSQIPLTAVQFQLKTSTNRIYLDIAESNVGMGDSESYFGQLIKKKIIDDAGITLTDHSETADMLLTGSVKTRFSSKIGEIYFCYADISISLVDKTSKDELYTIKIVGIKGADRTKLDASQRSIEKAAGQVLAELMPYIYESK